MINKILFIAQEAGRLILDIYKQPEFIVQQKSDNSPLTEADKLAHHYISHALKIAFPRIPIISEEASETIDYAQRQNWETFFLVDPLDGTKEFLQRNGEFTVNIALIHHNKPILGVIHAPVLDVTYYAEAGKGAHKIMNGFNQALKPNSPSIDILRVVISRSHTCTQTHEFLEKLKQLNKQIEITFAGSALKFGLIAEGVADIYPRFAPTMEWDTAAGQIVVNEMSKKLIAINNHETLLYNKPNLINPGFIVQ